MAKYTAETLSPEQMTTQDLYLIIKDILAENAALAARVAALESAE